jgi:hypothetical protein
MRKYSSDQNKRLKTILGGQKQNDKRKFGIIAKVVRVKQVFAEN